MEVVRPSTDPGICMAGATPLHPRAASTMTHDELRLHVAAAVTATEPAALRALTARIVSVCWPGGHQDRTNLAAREWLRQWPPQHSAGEVPVCACASGRCDICN